MAAMSSFYNLRAGPLEHLNGANIVLIPKTKTPKYAKDFRPISLVHSFGKLITKTGHQAIKAHGPFDLSFTECFHQRTLHT